MMVSNRDEVFAGPWRQRDGEFVATHLDPRLRNHPVPRHRAIIETWCRISYKICAHQAGSPKKGLFRTASTRRADFRLCDHKRSVAVELLM
jgi:hypothetical protein